VNDRSASGNEVPADFDIVVDLISEISTDSYHYSFQVPLKPGQELYPALGMFSQHLFGSVENETFEVAKGAGLVCANQKSKPFVKTQQWDEITNSISGFFCTKHYGCNRVFIFGLGSKGEKITMARQIKVKQALPKFSCLCLLCQQFKAKWKADQEAWLSKVEARSSNKATCLSKVETPSSSTNQEETHLSDNTTTLDLNYSGVTDNNPNLKNK
jgi:hypothetical protein